MLRGKDSDNTDETRHQDAQKAVLNDVLDTAALEQHQCKEAADDEEQLHPKSVDAKQNQANPICRRRVMAPPRDVWDIGQACVQNDTEEHRVRAKGIQGVVPRGWQLCRQLRLGIS